MNTGYNFLIVDDHPLFCEGLLSVLKKKFPNSSFTIANSIKSAEEKYNNRHNIIILDIMLPDGNGLDFGIKIKKRMENIKIFILSMSARIDYVRKAYNNGFCGYILKDSVPSHIAAAISVMDKGGFYTDEIVTEKLFTVISRKPSEGDADYDKYMKLTPREKEIFRTLAAGEETEDIAKKLDISKKTVESHRYRLIRKMNIKNMIDLARKAVKLKLVDFERWINHTDD